MSISYTVQSGDTLLYIAQKYGTTLRLLAQANNLDYPYFVYTGQILTIPMEYNSQSRSRKPLYHRRDSHKTLVNANTNDPGEASDQKSIEQIFEKAGSLQDGVLKFTFPRHDLKVRIGLVSLEPEFALTSWAAFRREDNQNIVMGDLVLLENEIESVIAQLIAERFDITALHNHLLYELPRIMFLHFSGIGNALRLAHSLKNVLSLTQTPFSSTTLNRLMPQDYWNAVEAIMGKKGNHIGKVLQFSFPRADIIREFDMVLPPSMGVSQAINFQAEGNKAAVTGDYVLVPTEVNPVVRVLKEHGISVAAIHNHMLFESPRLFFLHFWAVDKAERLAYGLKQALEQTNTAK